MSVADKKISNRFFAWLRMTGWMEQIFRMTGGEFSSVTNATFGPLMGGLGRFEKL